MITQHDVTPQIFSTHISLLRVHVNSFYVLLKEMVREILGHRCEQVSVPVFIVSVGMFIQELLRTHQAFVLVQAGMRVSSVVAQALGHLQFTVALVTGWNVSVFSGKTVPWPSSIYCCTGHRLECECLQW